MRINDKTKVKNKISNLPKINDEIIQTLDGKRNILQVQNLNVSFKIAHKKLINVVRNVDFEIREKQIVGIVGESGSGKSVTSKSFLNLDAFAITKQNQFILDGIDLNKISKSAWSKQIRGKKIGYIPQDPLTALNPTRTIGKQLLDVLENDPRFTTKKAKKDFLLDLLISFGIRDAKKLFNSYPHTFSGGMKQRVVITMAVAVQPKLIIADEPTTALDPTVQASVLALFEEVRKTHGISIIFISHNISVVAKFCDYIYVMYAGKILERGTKQEIFSNPQHPYTWALISSIPEKKLDKLYNIQGTPPDIANLPTGDPFAPRNDYAMEIDFKKEPPLFKINNSHYAATWLLDSRSPKVKKNSQLERRIKLFKKVFENE